MDWAIIITSLATTVTIIGFVYSFLRNFKDDINSHIDKLERRIDKSDRKVEILDERIFFLLTGRKLEDAILAEKMKNLKTDP